MVCVCACWWQSVVSVPVGCAVRCAVTVCCCCCCGRVVVVGARSGAGNGCCSSLLAPGSCGGSCSLSTLPRNQLEAWMKRKSLSPATAVVAVVAETCLVEEVDTLSSQLLRQGRLVVDRHRSC